jgi:hypothetical protein
MTRRPRIARASCSMSIAIYRGTDMAIYIKAGNGFDVGQDFNRVMVDTPITLAPGEYAKPGNVIGYIAGDPTSNLGSMRTPRVHVRRTAIGED